MKRNIAVAVIIVLLCAISLFADNRPYLIWDPVGSPSALAMHFILRQEHHWGYNCSNIANHLDSLSNFCPIIIISEYHDDDFGYFRINDSLLNVAKYPLLAYLQSGGAIYWEGINSIYGDPFYKDTLIGGFDIATCITYPFTSISGSGNPFEAITNLNCDSTVAPGIGLGGVTAFTADDLCPSKALAYTNPHRVFLTGVEFHQLNDTGLNSRIQYLELLFNWLEQTGIEEQRSALPDKAALGQNYPNPFNSSTVISYSLPHAGEIEIAVYNLIGQKIQTLYDGNAEAGQHQLVWNAAGRPTGVYFARLKTQGQAETIRLVLLK